MPVIFLPNFLGSLLEIIVIHFLNAAPPFVRVVFALLFRLVGLDSVNNHLIFCFSEVTGGFLARKGPYRFIKRG